MVRTSIFPSHFSRGGHLQRTKLPSSMHVRESCKSEDLRICWGMVPAAAARRSGGERSTGVGRETSSRPHAGRTELPANDTKAYDRRGFNIVRCLPPQTSSGRQCNMLARAVAAALVVTLPCAAATSEPDRPSWKAGHSVCHSFEGFQPTDLFPIRSPLVVADFLGPQLAHGAKYKRRPASPLSRRSLRGSSGLAARCCLRAALAFATHPGAWAAASLASGGSDCVVTLRRAARSARSARVTAT